MFGPCFMMKFFCNHLAGEERAVCFHLIFVLQSGGDKVFMSLSSGAVGCSALCDCDIS